MNRTPRPETTLVGFPPPSPADYSDEISEEQFEQISKELADYQDLDGEIVSGEPW